ncbi:AAA family ATPase [Paenibacillus typhae]|uniref:AAA family ATPase n=1 Tax=Paenibacillus typhae TaxID=1174501 RepID=UPI001C8D5EF0|nr:AAA family ATPase [Paenibacillus typhae]MBY0009643.1 AAA family ATPase [Paenibacillus typhae]
MSPQLLYIYLHKLSNCYEEQNFNFTNAFEVSYDPSFRELKLSPKDNPYEDLWGERIHNINLIIGRNGAGKSTLLDLLGSVKSNRVHRFPFENNSWFAIYHVVADTFLIEGYESDLLGNVQDLPPDIHVEYCITVKYDQKTGQLFASDYIQHAISNNHKSPIREQLLPLYLANSANQPWYSGQSNRFVHETYVGFQREYINHPLYANLYQFITTEYQLLEQDYTVKDALLTLNRNEDISSTFSTFDEEEKLLDLKLYNNKAELLLLKSDGFIRLYHTTSHPNDLWTAKEKFIIRHLEAVLASLLIQLKQNLSKKDFQIIRSLLAKVKLDSDNLNGRTSYLLQALHELQSAMPPDMHEFDLVFDYYAFEQIISDLIELDSRYFTSSKEATVSLKEGMDPKLVHFLQHYDDMNPRVGGSSLQVSFQQMSTGELEFINGFANLYRAVYYALNDKQVETILLLIDEPDASFHPEWSRRYIANLVKFLEKGNFTRAVKFQILLTTHSPFMVSDVPKEHINCIKITMDNGEIKRTVQQADFGLMSNIYDIMKSDFFIGAPIGEFASQIFKRLLNKIERLDTYDSREVEQISGLIEGIGEEVLRKKLTQMLNNRITKLEPELLQIKKIELLQKELELEREKLNRQRKGRNSND